MSRFRHVVAAVDLTSRSRHTLFHAAEIARSSEATLTVLHVHPDDQHLGAVYVPEVPVPEIARFEDLGAVAGKLHALVDGLGLAACARVAIAHGDPGAELVAFAEAYGADLIVLGRRPHRGLERLLRRSVSEAVAHKAPCSVLSVPRALDEARRPPTDTAEILCAVDFSDASVETLKAAAEVARQRGAHLTVLNCVEAWSWEDPWPPARGDEQAVQLALRLSAHERMSKLLAAYRATELAVDTLLMVGAAEQEILRAASARAADLVVVGARSDLARAGGSAQRLGATAAHVLHRAPCQVLLARPVDARASQERGAPSPAVATA
jgi:nucleotide-binding universal stress UspA family protein